MGMDQYLLIPFLGGWTSIYQLFWCSPGVQGFDTLPYIYYNLLHIKQHTQFPLPEASRLVSDALAKAKDNKDRIVGSWASHQS